MSATIQASWCTAGGAVRLWFPARTLSKTLKIAVMVGTLLSAIKG